MPDGNGGHRSSLMGGVFIHLHMLPSIRKTTTSQLSEEQATDDRANRDCNGTEATLRYTALFPTDTNSFATIPQRNIAT